ncbi:MAG: TonB-dependent receptor [Cytophagales bacterium]|nr:MAG: TonB-dependent receptor [Cytophagales bacterium]TAH30967.1 MAG: TonB-dependent receptor [Cytophagales bacterium]
MFKNFYLILLLMCIVTGVSSAQTITGKVLDNDTKSGIPGVSVFVKGTTQGTTTDIDGNYAVNVTSGSVLSFESIGYGSQQVLVSNQKVIDVVLLPDIKNLSEAVVIGYATIDSRDVTGAVVGVKADEIKDIPVQSFESALQGRVTGVQITAGSGKVGQGFNIRVRGSSSLTGGNQPLYVVDGILITSSAVNSNDEGINPTADINPNDIESIDVLKDAAATAIYGSRGANGVILITTKKGKAGKSTMNVNFSTGISQPTRKRGFLNRSQYIELFSESLTNVGLSQVDIEGELNSLSPTWRDPSVDINWEDLALRSGQFKQFDLSASGGNEKTTYYVGGSYNDSEGIIVGNRFQRLSARLSLETKVNDKLKIGGSLMLARSKNFRAAADNQFNNQLQLVAMPPIQTPYGADGRTNLNTVYYNALTELSDAKNTAVTLRNLSNLYGIYTIMPGLTFRSEVGLDLMYLVEETYNGRRTSGNTGAAQGIGTYNTTLVTNYTLTNSLNYSKTINKMHQIDALLGTSYQQSDLESSSVEGRVFASDAFRTIASAATITAGSSFKTNFNFLSYFARGSYKFNDKYLVSVSARLDGSSRFAPNTRYGFYPAASLGWVASEESFIKSIKQISFLKLRMGYGATGNAEIGNFDYLGLYGTNAYGTSSGTLPTNAPNSNLKWETTYQFDSAIELGLFNDRLNITVDVYQKNTRDLLLNVPTPSTSGFTVQTQNLGRISNRGLEIDIRSKNLVGEFKWNTSFNISFNRNSVDFTNGQIIQPGNRSRIINDAREGEPIGVLYGVKYAGVDPANGDALYFAQDGSKTKNYNAAFRQKIGDPNPTFIGGFTNSFSYKGLELTIFTQFVQGNNIYNMAGGFMSANGDFYDNQTLDQLGRWRNPGDITNIPQARFDDGNGTRMSSRYVYDGSYIRLKTLTLAYNFPKSWLNKSKLSSLRVYLMGQNLLTRVANGFQGWDPELSAGFTQTSNQSSNIVIGNDFYTPPQPRTVTAGINIGF